MYLAIPAIYYGRIYPSETPTKVEKNQACMKLTMKECPQSCHFKDILSLVDNPPKSGEWKPGKLKLVKEAYCQTHKKKFFGFCYRCVLFITHAFFHLAQLIDLQKPRICKRCSNRFTQGALYWLAKSTSQPRLNVL